MKARFLQQGHGVKGPREVRIEASALNEAIGSTVEDVLGVEYEVSVLQRKVSTWAGPKCVQPIWRFWFPADQELGRSRRMGHDQRVDRRF
jgi:hypothetical protein